MIWGKTPVPYKVPEILNFPLIEISGMSYPAYSIFRLTLSVVIFLLLQNLIKDQNWSYYKSIVNKSRNGGRIRT